MLTLSSAALAQQRPGPAFPRPGMQNPLQEGELGSEATMSASVIGGYDDNITQDVGRGGGGAPRSQVGGSFAGASLSLGYTKQGSRVGFGASGGGNFRHYNAATPFNADSYGAGLGLTAELSRRTRFQSSARASLAPWMNAGLFPDLVDPGIGQVLPPSLDQALSLDKFAQYRFNASLDHELTRRSSLEAYYDSQYTDGRDTTRFNFDTWQVGGRYRRSMTENLSLRLGYGYRQGRFDESLVAANRSLQHHDIDVGVDYSNALPISRNTTVGFGLGSVITNDSRDTRYNVTGNASLSHLLSRTWSLSVAYDRRLRYIPGFAEVVFGDSVSASVGGALGSRTTLVFSTGYSDGIGFGRQGSRYDTYLGSARLNVLAARLVTVFSEYFYYHYDFSDRQSLPVGFLSNVDRQGVRGGMTFNLPLMRGR